MSDACWQHMLREKTKDQYKHKMTLLCVELPFDRTIKFNKGLYFIICDLIWLEFFFPQRKFFLTKNLHSAIRK